jgi:hypothetical protein
MYVCVCVCVSVSLSVCLFLCLCVSAVAPIQIGDVMRGIVVGEVVQSHSSKFSPGDLVQVLPAPTPAPPLLVFLTHHAMSMYAYP